MIRVPALHPSRPHATPCDTARDDPSQCPKMDTRHADGASGTTKWCLGSQMGVPELSPDDLRLRRRALWDALNSAGRRGVYRAGSRRGEDTRTFYERDESAMLRVRGGFSRPQTCSDQTSTKPTWWPQRDSNPCFSLRGPCHRQIWREVTRRLPWPATIHWHRLTDQILGYAFVRPCEGDANEKQYPGEADRKMCD
jgi:hypothetical protein